MNIQTLLVNVRLPFATLLISLLSEKFALAGLINSYRLSWTDKTAKR